MKKLTLSIPYFFIFFMLAAPLAAQQNGNATKDSWDVTEPRGDVREIDFTTDEGTWMSIDVSPNGEWIVFDMMGQIYRMSTEGGQAESLTQKSGVAWNFHPAYSPDGEHIAFISDQKGQNNLWIMNADGTDPHPVYTNNYIQASQPEWTPDGNYIIVKRDGVGSNGGSGKDGLWMYHIKGGDGIPLITDEDVENPAWPSISDNGKYLYFQVATGGAGEPLSGNYQLRRYNFETGRILALTSGNGSQSAAASRLTSGGPFAPVISPDGKWLAYGRWIPNGKISYNGHEFGPRTTLWLRNLETGAEHKIMDPITAANNTWWGILPRYTWTDDSKSIIITQGGKIRHLDIASGDVETIPFKARIHRIISEQAYTPFRITNEAFQPKFLRWFEESPDGSKLVFQAVGQIWVMELPDGTPRRLTPDSYGRDKHGLAEFAPTWSPDGKHIAFTTLNAWNQGNVWRVAQSGGEPQKLTQKEAFYTNPVWSPDGNYVVVTRGGGAIARGRTVTGNAYFELVKIPAAGGNLVKIATIAKPARVTPNGYARRAIPAASFGPEGRIYFPDQEYKSEKSNNVVTALVSINPDGTDRKVHISFPHASAVVPSPDGSHVAFEEGGNIYIAPLPAKWTNAEPIYFNKADAALPVTQVSKQGGLFPVWLDSHTVAFGSANHYYTYNLNTGEKDDLSIEFTVPVAQPSGVVALVGARIITMNVDEQNVIEEGVVVIENGRIRCVGEGDACDISDADREIDVRGKTIMPGIIDMHSHHYRQNRGHRPPNDYEVAIYLAYGITTSLDNSMWSRNIFPTAERIKAGRLIGPRTYSTGDPLYQGDGPNQNKITSYQKAKDNVLRLKSWGAVSIKQYSNVRRDQRQWIIDAAREAGLMVAGHWRPGIVMDGHTGIEHAFPYVRLYDDMTKFYGMADVVYDPTMVVSGPGPEGLDYWIAKNKVWQNKKQRYWMPWRLLTFTRWRDLRPTTDYAFPFVAEGMKDIIEAGGWGSIGGHGEHHALTPHWEIWMAAEALGPMGALKVATVHGAHFLGAQKDLGSIEKGKLADLLILNSNPLDDIKNTLDIKYVMKNGVVYDAVTLDEIWPKQKPFGPRYWSKEDALIDDVRPMNYWQRENKN